MPALIEKPALIENDAIYIPTYDFWGEHEFEQLEHCRHSPMLKTAQYTSYRLTHKSPSHFHPPRIDLSVTRPLSSRHTSPKREQSSPIRKAREYKMAGNRKNEVPKPEMVHFAGLLNTERKFGDFRTVLHTGLYSQLVAMEVPVNGEIGDEVHTVDQILLFTSGTGLATVAGVDQEVKAGDVVIVPAGSQHQFVTKGDQPLELVTIYSPAEHDPMTVHKTKEEGDKEEQEGKDEAPEWSQQSKKFNEEKGLVK